MTKILTKIVEVFRAATAQKPAPEVDLFEATTTLSIFITDCTEVLQTTITNTDHDLGPIIIRYADEINIRKMIRSVCQNIGEQGWTEGDVHYPPHRIQEIQIGATEKRQIHPDEE